MCIYIYIHVYVYKYMYIRVSLSVFIYLCLFVYIFVSIFICSQVLMSALQLSESRIEYDIRLRLIFRMMWSMACLIVIIIITMTKFTISYSLKKVPGFWRI